MSYYDVESRMIDFLRFPLIVLVVCIHTPEYAVGMTSLFWGGFTEFIVNYIARIAVPVLFVISSYLFFRNNDFSYSSYLGKLKRRIGSLLVPYVLWNAFLIVALSLNDFDSVFGGSSFAGNLSTFFSAFFNYKSTNGPVAIQFWFVRDLIVLNLLSPVFFYILRHRVAGHLLVFALLLLWLVYGDGEVHMLGISSVFFYVLGAWMGVNRVEFTDIGQHCRIWPLIYAVLVWLDFRVDGYNIHHFYHNVVIIIGCILAMRIAYLVCSRTMSRSTLAKSSFFIFAFHAPWGLSISKKLLSVIGMNDLFPSYISTLVVCFAVSLAAYSLLKKFEPRILAILNGNRIAE